MTVAQTGVPDALRGVTHDAPVADASRPVVQADLAARHHDVAVETVPVESAEAPVVRDEDVFTPQTPGGPVLAHGARPKEYEAEERVALPGADGRPPAR